MKWNLEEYEKIFQRKNICKARLAVIQRALESSQSPSLEKLERKLLDELDELLEHEETYWRQKVRVKWITEGERNTRFFYSSVVARRRCNRILQLKDGNGEWCADEKKLKEQVVEFYGTIYSKEPHCHAMYAIGGFRDY